MENPTENTEVVLTEEQRKEIEKQFLDMLTDSTADSIAKEIVDSLVTEANEKNFYTQYNMKGGKLVGTKANTWFIFDTKEGTVLDKFKKNFINYKVNIIDRVFEGAQTQENTQSISEAGIKQEQIKNFLAKIGELIPNHYSQTIRDTIRRVIMPSINEKKAKLTNIIVKGLEIDDFSDFAFYEKYLLRIDKEPGAIINTRAVTTDISRIIGDSEGKKTPEQAFEESKNNPLYLGITGITLGEKYLIEVKLTLFVDYSLSDEFLEALATNDPDKIKAFEV